MCFNGPAKRLISYEMTTSHIFQQGLSDIVIIIIQGKPARYSAAEALFCLCFVQAEMSAHETEMLRLDSGLLWGKISRADYLQHSSDNL